METDAELVHLLGSVETLKFNSKQDSKKELWFFEKERKREKESYISAI